MGKRAYVFATGGLGNQLFQVAAALGSECDELRVVPNRKNARKNMDDHLDIEDFHIGEKVIFDRDIKLWKLSQKAVNYTLRYFAGQKPEHPRKFYESSILFAADSLLSMNLRKVVHICANRGLGFDPTIQTPTLKNFFVGYFQTYQVLTKTIVNQTMFEMRLSKDSAKLKEFRMLADSEVPLIVHVRMGDYQESDLFGVLPQDYYRKAIDLLWNSGKYKKIWLFSDEPEKAMNQIPVRFHQYVRVVPDFDNSTAITFEVMRLGHGYVIANSTFSWWAASLSRNTTGQIAAPDVWFAKATSPEQILPPHWIKVEAWQ